MSDKGSAIPGAHDNVGPNPMNCNIFGSTQMTACNINHHSLNTLHWELKWATSMNLQIHCSTLLVRFSNGLRSLYMQRNKAMI
jgi:hypothetical protein